MKIRIAIIIERADIVLGGAERSILELATTLSGVGFDVSILAAKGQTNARNIHILCPGRYWKRTNYFTLSKAVRRHLAANEYDIVHSVLPFGFADVYQPRGGTYRQAILQNAASYRSSLVRFYKRATAFANWRRTILLEAERKLCKRPDGPVIAALSKYVARQFRENYNVDSERLFVIPNGIRLNSRVDSTASDRLRSQILYKLGLKEADEPVLFLFVANNFRLKGLSVLIDALAAARNKFDSRKAYLVVAGNGKSYKYRLKARKMGVHKKIIYLGHARHIQNVLSITDVSILPTFYDPSSRFILESLSAGKPVITTRFNGAIDMFEDGRHGIVVDRPENIRALAEAICYFTKEENLRQAREAIQADNLKEQISIRRAAKQLAGLYETVLEKKGK